MWDTLDKQRRLPRKSWEPSLFKRPIGDLQSVRQLLVHGPNCSERLSPSEFARPVSFSFLLRTIFRLWVRELLHEPILRFSDLCNDQAGFASTPCPCTRNFHTYLLRKNFAVNAALFRDF